MISALFFREWIARFVERGGPVLVVIFCVGWLAWFFLLERVWILWSLRGLSRRYADCVRQWGQCGDLALRRVLEAERHRIRTLIGRHHRTITRLAAVAPLLGLLGTVSGMVHTFETITRFGFGNPVLLAEGISEALLTTEAGLLVAFPVVLFSQMVRQRLDTLEKRAWAAALAAGGISP